MRPITKILILFTFLAASAMPQHVMAQKKKEKEQKAEITKYERANAEYLLIEAQKFFLLEDFEKAQAFLDQSLEIDASNHAAHFKIAEINFVTEKYDRGLQAIKRALDLELTNKYYYILAAQLYKAKNDLPAAVAQYEAMIRNTSDYKEYLLDLVDLYVELTDYNKALSILELTEKEFGTPDKFMLQKKELLVQAGKTDQAIDYLRKLLDSGHSDAGLINEYSALLSATGREAEAIAYLSSEFTNDPLAAPVLMKLYVRTNQFDQAKPLLSQILEQQSLSKDETLGLATDLMALENEESLPLVKELLDQVLGDTPGDIEALALQSQLLTRLSASTENTDTIYEKQAIEALLKLKENDPSNYQNWKRILDYQYDQQDWQALLTESESSLDYFPNQGLFYFYFASANLYTQNFDEVTDLLDQALKLSFSNDSLKSRIYAKQGELAYANGQSAEAGRFFEQALTQLRLPEVINNYSFQLALRKIDQELALQLVEELVTSAPSNMKYIRIKAFTLFQWTSYAQARQVLEGGLQQYESQVDGPTRELYGDILIKLDLVDEAVAQWQKAKALGNTSDKLDQKIANKEYFD